MSSQVQYLYASFNDRLCYFSREVSKYDRWPKVTIISTVLLHFQSSILMSYSMVTKPNHDVGCLTSTHHSQTKTILLDSKTNNKRKNKSICLKKALQHSTVLYSTLLPIISNEADEDKRLDWYLQYTVHISVLTILYHSSSSSSEWRLCLYESNNSAYHSKAVIIKKSWNELLNST